MTPNLEPARLRQMAAAVAALSMDSVEKAKSGHPGMPMGMAIAATVLFTRHLKFDMAAPDWPDRDRFVLSAGHGSMLLYSLLHLLGSADMPMAELQRFRQLGARTAGHPEYGHAAGIETTTGPLGQGLANAVGMAMAEAHLRARFGAELVDHHTYVIAGDGCLMEGISQEAIGLAGHLRLSRLIVLWDDNRITIDGAVSLADSTDQAARFAASGWATLACDGHDPADVDRALQAAKQSDRPVLIACRTTIGYGAAKKAGTSGAHGSPLGAEEIAAARRALDWPHAPFEVPADILSAWREAGRAGASAHAAWAARLAGSSAGAAFSAQMALDPAPALAALTAHATAQLAAPKPMATRKASELALEAINAAVPFTLGGSADLTGSNNTRTPDLGIHSAAAPGARYVHYGIREHGMAAAMNGIALHGGVIPYGGTFLVFADYARPAIRLAALMGIRVIFVLTHDSIGLGEDGPTHQPVEHLASLRAIPNVLVLRPADAIETAEAWAIALSHDGGPSVLALTRQNLPLLRTDAAQNRSRAGGYILADGAPADGTLIATGSEVEIAMAARAALAEAGLSVRVVSMPSVELFRALPEAEQRAILGTGPRVVVEAGIRQGWDEILYKFGGRGDFVGMTGFGASGPYEELYAHFGITAAAVAARLQQLHEGK